MPHTHARMHSLRAAPLSFCLSLPDAPPPHPLLHRLPRIGCWEMLLICCVVVSPVLALQLNRAVLQARPVLRWNTHSR